MIDIYYIVIGKVENENEKFVEKRIRIVKIEMKK